MRRALLLLSLLLAAPLAADNLGWGWDLKGGLSVPVSPTGPNSFSQAYGSAPQGAFGMDLRFDPAWQFGLEAQFNAYSHHWVAGTQLSTWSAGLMGEWDLPPADDGPQDHLYLQVGGGFGGAHLNTDALYQSRQWTSGYGRLGLGWDLPLTAWLNLLLEADGWTLIGPGKADPITAFSLNLGLRFGIPPKDKERP